ncbi:MAG: N-terminal phage integrase SAM-like domain-containing protein, partial [Streptococcus vestibularis]
MKINEIKKKDGSTVYRANIYLGVDVVTGKKVTTKVTARTKKELKTKAQQAQFDFKANGSTRYKEVVIETYEALATSWWDNYKNTVKVNTRKLQKSILDKHLLPLFGSFKLDKLTTPLIQSIMNKLANSTNTGEVGAYLHYDKIHALNKRILQYGVVLQVIPTNPAS